MSSFTSFLFSSFVGSNQQEFSNIRNLTSQNRSQNPGSSMRDSMRQPVELPAQDSKESKDVPLPSGSEVGDGDINNAPPPYSVHPTPSNSVTSPLGYPISGVGTPTTSRLPEVSYPIFDSHRVPESDAINAQGAVEFSGPLNILGNVNSSSRVTLSDGIKVGGKVNSSSDITLSNGIAIEGKLSASGRIKIDGGKMGVKVAGKANASGSIEILGGSGGVEIGEKVDCSGGCLIDGGLGGVRVAGKVNSSGSIELRGSVEVGEKVDAGGKIKIICSPVNGHNEMGRVKVGTALNGPGGVSIEGNLEVESEMKVGGQLSIDGRLFVKGNLTVKGDVHLQPGSELVVTGKRTIHGSIKQAKVV